MADNKTFFKIYRNALLWAFFILVLCLAPIGGGGHLVLFGTLGADKLAHFGVFFILYVLLYSAHRVYFPLHHIGKRAFICFLIAVVFGITVECLQAIPLFKRAFEFLDIIADSAGALFGMLLCLFKNKNDLRIKFF